jgi:transcription termination/antitermination protein NusA
MPANPESHAAAVACFVGILDLPRAEAVALADVGFTSLEEVAYVPLEELFEVEGLGEERLLQVRARARSCLNVGLR